MSTHATIWIKNSNDTFTGIYCHFDGYLSGVGDTLLKHYNVESAAAGLISLGAISSLGVYAERPKTAVDSNEWFTVAYCRDRGEELSVYQAVDADDIHNYIEEYNYVWAFGAWYVYGASASFNKLTHKLIAATE